MLILRPCFSKVDDSSALNMIRDHVLYPLMALSGCLMDRLGESSSGVAELQTVRTWTLISLSMTSFECMLNVSGKV